MNTDILMPILTISGIAIAAGYLLNVLEKAVAHKFDERQLIERGRGANLSMNAAMMYLLGLYMGYAFDLLRPEYWSIFAVYGLIVMMMVFDAHCIFHDAFQQRGEKLGTRILSDGFLGALLLVTALQKAPWDPETAWINGAFALFWLSRSGMLLLRTVVLYIQDQRTAKEEADG